MEVPDVRCPGSGARIPSAGSALPWTGGTDHMRRMGAAQEGGSGVPQIRLLGSEGLESWRRSCAALNGC